MLEGNTDTDAYSRDITESPSLGVGGSGLGLRSKYSRPSEERAQAVWATPDAKISERHMNRGPEHRPQSPAASIFIELCNKLALLLRAWA